MSGDLPDGPRPCPYCGRQLEKAATIDGRGDLVMKPGDIAVCIECARWVVLTPYGAFREFTDDDARALSDDRLDELFRATHLIRRMQRAERLGGRDER